MKRKEIFCPICKKLMMVTDYQLKIGKRYCSNKCRNIGFSQFRLLQKGIPFSQERINNMRTRKEGDLRKNDGYYYIYKFNHSLAVKKYWVKRCFLIWEEQTGEIITRPFILHHINNIRTDDRIENLQKMTLFEHRKLHLDKINEGKKCDMNI